MHLLWFGEVLILTTKEEYISGNGVVLPILSTLVDIEEPAIDNDLLKIEDLRDESSDSIDIEKFDEESSSGDMDVEIRK